MKWEEKKKLCLYKGESQINKKYGEWTVLGYSRTKHKPSGSVSMWKVQCSCGSISETTAYNLVYGKTTGCPKCYGKRHTGCNNSNWKGFGNIPSTLWGRILNGAKYRNLQVEVDIEYLDNLWKQQDGKCALSGVDLSTEDIFDNPAWSDTASLDRIDSTKGYIEGNLQWVHPVVNIMKNRFERRKADKNFKWIILLFVIFYFALSFVSFILIFSQVLI